MLRLQGHTLYLRALEPEDLDFLYALENDTSIWEVSGTRAPYARHVLKKYLDNAFRDIYEVKQLRLAICEKEGRLIGLIDLFDFDPGHRRAGVGVVIRLEEDRHKGRGTEALQILEEYAFNTLNLRQLYANVGTDNKASIELFKKLGYEVVGVKKDWIRTGAGYKDETLFQKINR